jgi:ribosomal protein S18 acetylase RimI-like enzyme
LGLRKDVAEAVRANETTDRPVAPESVRVRRIGPDEGALLKALRLRALAEEPEAFGESVAEAEARDEAEYAARARSASDGDRRAWFLAEAEADPSPAKAEADPSSAEAWSTLVAPTRTSVGLAMGRRRPPDECMVFSVWVANAARGRGVGRALVDAVADWARAWGASRLVLWVYRSNRGAIRFYERLGFTVETSGPDAELGAPHDALAMHRGIRAAETPLPTGAS